MWSCSLLQSRNWGLRDDGLSRDSIILPVGLKHYQNEIFALRLGTWEFYCSLHVEKLKLAFLPWWLLLLRCILYTHVTSQVVLVLVLVGYQVGSRYWLHCGILWLTCTPPFVASYESDPDSETDTLQTSLPTSAMAGELCRLLFSLAHLLMAGSL